MDRYTKAVLTIIAAALAVIALREVIPSATALGQSNCGGTYNPCNLNVTVTLHHSGPIRLQHEGRISN